MKCWEAVVWVLMICSFYRAECWLTLTSISAAENVGAYCNDKKPAIYYIEKRNSNGWVVHFEGGGGCYSYRDCNERYKQGALKNLMSPSNYPDSIQGADILSSSPDENDALAGFSQVLVPYCSSDGWLGSRSLNNTGVAFNTSADADNFAFRGHVIFQAVVNELITAYNLTNSSELILVGTSAGGIGVLNHLTWVRAQLPGALIKVVVDSAWFIEFGGRTVSSWSQPGSGAFTNLEACGDTSLGYPCCVSAACLFDRDYLTDSLNIPIFLVSSIYDIYVLKDTLTPLLQGAEASSDDLLRTFNSYGALMNASLVQTASAHRNVSVYAPSCTQHVYLATSSLWSPTGGILNATENGTYQQGDFWLTNYILEGIWNRVSISANGTDVTLHEAIVKWYKSGGEQAVYVDGCKGPVCSRTCTSGVGITLGKHQWSSAVNVTVLVLVGAEVLACLAAKLVMYATAKYLLLRQRGFLQRRKVRFPPPRHKVGISCLNLTYRVETVSRPRPALHCLSSLCYGRAKSKVLPVIPRVTPDSGHESLADHGCHSNIRHSGNTITTLLQNHSSLGTKTILRDVNFYVNPGELAAIMGPSGCGKTTLLDILLGQRASGSIEGDVFINGVPLKSVKDWFVLNAGYVRQLAVSFYSELTVRQNLLLSMTMQSQKGQSTYQILERVEQVIQETGLQETADIKVGSESGLGISGGQKRKLGIAVQLLSMPSILFLDEPTSGLDSASSLEVLHTLRQLVDTGHTVIVTIHQPRSKVFHMFDKILFLSKGNVAFFGSPLKVFEFINTSLRQQVTLHKDVNPADALLDLLKKEDLQKQLVSSYWDSGDPRSIEQAVNAARAPVSEEPLATFKRNPGLWQRIMSLEARASLRQSKFSIVYLPILYPLFGVVLGTTYYNTTAIQVLSLTCVLCCSSALFMSGIVMNLLLEPLKIFHLEYADGIAYCYDIIFHVFVRMTAVSLLPLLVCFLIVSGLVYHIFGSASFMSILLIFLADNQVWVALFIVIGVLFPPGAARICAVMSAIGGFFCGFIVPVTVMPAYYKWITYINPSFYAYSAIGAIVLSEREQLDCGKDSKLECFSESGLSLLKSFGLEYTNPFMNLLIMAAMTVTLLVLAVVVLMCRMRYQSFQLYSWLARLWVGCRGNCGSTPSTGDVFDHTHQLTTHVRCPAQFLANGDAHVIFSGEGEEMGEETDAPPLVGRGRLLSDPRVPPRRLTSKLDPSNQSEVVIVLDEEERLRLTDQKIRERRERMNNEIRRLKHFNNIMGGKGIPNASVNGHPQTSGEGCLGRSMGLSQFPRGPAMVHRSSSVDPSVPSQRQADLEASGYALQPLPEKDMPVLDEGSGNLESLDLNSIPENEVNLSDYDDNVD